MILIADSSALVALSVVDKLDVLEQLFGEVYEIAFSGLDKGVHYNARPITKDKIGSVYTKG